MWAGFGSHRIDNYLRQKWELCASKKSMILSLLSLFWVSGLFVVHVGASSFWTGWQLTRKTASVVFAWLFGFSVFCLVKYFWCLFVAFLFVVLFGASLIWTGWSLTRKAGSVVFVGLFHFHFFVTFVFLCIFCCIFSLLSCLVPA